MLATSRTPSRSTWTGTEQLHVCVDSKSSHEEMHLFISQDFILSRVRKSERGIEVHEAKKRSEMKHDQVTFCRRKEQTFSSANLSRALFDTPVLYRCLARIASTQVVLFCTVVVTGNRKTRRGTQEVRP